MFQAFAQSGFKDCRISAYQYVRNSTGILHIPNLLLLDIDLDYKVFLERGRERAIKNLKGNN